MFCCTHKNLKIICFQLQQTAHYEKGWNRITLNLLLTSLPLRTSGETLNSKFAVDFTAMDNKWSNLQGKRALQALPPSSPPHSLFSTKWRRLTWPPELHPCTTIFHGGCSRIHGPKAYSCWQGLNHNIVQQQGTHVLSKTVMVKLPWGNLEISENYHIWLLSSQTSAMLHPAPQKDRWQPLGKYTSHYQTEKNHCGTQLNFFNI